MSNPLLKSQLAKSVGREWFNSAFGYTLRTAWALCFGSVAFKERLGILGRPYYAYGLHRAAEMARSQGLKRVTVCEFGVASGLGLLNLVTLAKLFTKETGISFRITGFDTGDGLGAPVDFKDHPEIWTAGNFRLKSRETLTQKIASRAEMYWGDIRETVSDFVTSLTPQCPLGFVAVDVDFYSSAREALRCLCGGSTLYSPAVPIYFDDIDFFTSNSWCGELSAIREFNDGHSARKIDRDLTLPGGPERPVWQRWYPKMYVAHILDHPLRQPG